MFYDEERASRGICRDNRHPAATELAIEQADAKKAQREHLKRAAKAKKSKDVILVSSPLNSPQPKKSKASGKSGSKKKADT